MSSLWLDLCDLESYVLAFSMRFSFIGFDIFDYERLMLSGTCMFGLRASFPTSVVSQLFMFVSRVLWCESGQRINQVN